MSLDQAARAFFLPSLASASSRVSSLFNAKSVSRTLPRPSLPRLGAPLLTRDRFELPDQRVVERLVHPRDRNDFERALDAIRNLGESVTFSSGISTVLIPPRRAASSFSLRPSIGHARPRSVISPVMARRNAGHHRDDSGRHGDACRRVVLGGAPSGTWTWMSQRSNRDGSMPKSTARERT